MCKKCDYSGTLPEIFRRDFTMKKLLSYLLTVCFAVQSVFAVVPMGIGVEAAEEVSVQSLDAQSVSVALASDKQEFTGNEWTGVDGNANIHEVNREASRVDSIPYSTEAAAKDAALNYDKSQSVWYKKLTDGTKWSFKLYNTDALLQASADNAFYADGFDYSAWNKIDVPSVWQLQLDENGQRYDDIRYSNVTPYWKNDHTGNTFEAPGVPTVYNPVGLYKYDFMVDEAWTKDSGRRVYMTFEGVGSCMYLWINGKAVGYAEDTFMSSEFDVTDYIVAGKNTLSAKVIRWSDGSHLENQDGFNYSGIFRDVYIYSTDNLRLRDYTVVTDLDSTFTNASLKVNAYVSNHEAAAATDTTVTVKLYDADGEAVSISDNSKVLEVPANSETTFSFDIAVTNPKKWTAETPNLYTMVIELKQGENVVSYDSYLIGFREITYRKLSDGTPVNASQCTGTYGVDWEYDRVRINGQYMYFKGVNHNDITSWAGYAIDYATLEKDIQIIKSNNINAVRTSHYPSNPYFYYLCNKYGLYVMDEANQESTVYGGNVLNQFADAIEARSTRMIKRDRNNPCIVMWSYGNESGVEPNADGKLHQMPEIIHDLDPTRPVQYEPIDSDSYARTADRGAEVEYPITGDSGNYAYKATREKYEGVDVKSSMYRTIDYMKRYGSGNSGKFTPDTMTYIQCEYVHAMGNSLGSIGDYWDVIRQYDNLQGGFIWDFADQGVDMDDNGTYYLGYGGDNGEAHHDNNFCANGIVSADRTLQPEIFEAQRVYQNIQFNVVDAQSGVINLSNENVALNTNDYNTLKWEVLENHKVIKSGTMEINVAPLQNKDITIPFGTITVNPASEYFLNLELTREIYDCYGNRLYDQDGQPMVEYNKAQFNLPSNAGKLTGKSASEIGEVTYTNGVDTLTVNAGNAVITIDKNTGLMDSYVLNGKELFDEPLRPDLDKAYIDNDRVSKRNGGEAVRFYDQVENATATVTKDVCEIKDGQKVVGVSVSFNMLISKKLTASWKPASLNTNIGITYHILGGGEVKVMYDVASGEADISKLGSNVILDKDFTKLTFFGKGPFENYNDRNRASDVGLYTQTPDEMFVNFIKPNDSGNHTDVRFALAHGDNMDEALMFVSEGELLQVGATHYKDKDISSVNNPDKSNLHIHQVPKQEGMVLDVDYLVRGVATGAAGPDVLGQYTVPSTGTYGYSLRPVSMAALSTDDAIVTAGTTALPEIAAFDFVKANEALKEYVKYVDNEEGYTAQSFMAFDKVYTAISASVNGRSTDSQRVLDENVARLPQLAAALVSNAALDTSVLNEKVNASSDEALKSAVAAAMAKYNNQIAVNALTLLMDDQNGGADTLNYLINKGFARDEEYYNSESYVKVQRNAATAEQMIADGVTPSQIADFVGQYATEILGFTSLEVNLSTKDGVIKTGTDNTSIEGAHEWDKGINMFDGNLGNAADFAKSGGAGYAQVDTGSMYSLTRIVYYPRYESDIVNNRIVGIKFLGSVDGNTWNELGVVATPSSSLDAVALTPINSEKYRYFKVEVPSGAYGLREVEFYANELDVSYLETCVDNANRTLDIAPADSVADINAFIGNANNVIANKTDYTQKQINDTCLEWFTLSDTLGAGKRGELFEKISEFEALDMGIYTPESYVAAYISAKNAKAVYNNSASTSEQLENAFDDLTSKLNALAGVQYTKVHDKNTTAWAWGGKWNSSGAYPADGDVQTGQLVFDENLTTYADFADPGYGYGAIDLGEGNERVVNKIVYYVKDPQHSWSNRIIGITFEGSNDKENWNVLAKIEQFTQNNATETLYVSDSTPYRYLRYNSENVKSFGNMYELEFYTISDKTMLASKITEAKAITDTSIPSYTALQTAIANAESINNNAGASQNVITQAVIDLVDVMEIAQAEFDNTDVLAKAKNLNINEYTALSYIAVKDAYEAYLEVSTSTDAVSINKAIETLANAVNALVEVPKFKLTGTVSGVVSSDITNPNAWQTLGGMFDGNVNIPSEIGGWGTGHEAYAQIDTGGSYSVGQIRYWSRFENESTSNRIIGISFEGSNDQQSWTKLGEITQPGNSEWVTLDSLSLEKFRYFRVYIPANKIGIGEAEFISFGTEKSIDENIIYDKLALNTDYVINWTTYNDTSNNHQNAFDGNKETYPDFSGSGYGAAGIIFNKPTSIDKIIWYPRQHQWYGRLNGTTLEASTDNVNWDVLHTVSAVNSTDWSGRSVMVDSETQYNYFRFNSLTVPSYGDIAEIELFKVASITTDLTRTIAQAKELLANGNANADILNSAIAQAETADAAAYKQSDITNATIALLDAMEIAQGTTITFETKVGTCSEDEVTKKIGDKVYLPGSDAVSADGYTFAGWFDGQNLYASGSEYTVPSSNVTLTAHWTAPVAITIENSDVEYYDGYVTVKFDKAISKESAVPANFGGNEVSYVELADDGLSAKVYLNYAKYVDNKVYINFARTGNIVVKDLVDATGTVTLTGSETKTVKLVNTKINQDGELIPNGNFDIPWNTATKNGGGIAVEDPTGRDGYSLFIPYENMEGFSAKENWNYAWFYADLDETKQYWLEYDAMPYKEYNDNIITSKKKLFGAYAGSTSWWGVGANVNIPDPGVAYGTWGHAEGLITPKDGETLTDAVGIYANPTQPDGTNNKPIAFFVDNVSLKEAFAIEFKSEDGTTTLSETLYRPAGKTITLPTAGEGLVWYDGAKTYASGEQYKTIGKAVTFKVVNDITAPETGNSIDMRIKTPAGIRFRANVTDEHRSGFAGAVEYGFIVARADKLEEAGIADVDLTFNIDTSLYTYGASYVKADGDVTPSIDRLYDADFGNNIYTFTGVMTGIPAAYSKIPLTARPYFKANAGTENEVVYYGEPRTESIYNIALSLKASSEYEKLTDEQKAFVDSMIG